MRYVDFSFFGVDAITLQSYIVTLLYLHIIINYYMLRTLDRI